MGPWNPSLGKVVGDELTLYSKKQIEKNSVCVYPFHFFPFNLTFGSSFSLIALNSLCKIRKLSWK